MDKGSTSQPLRTNDVGCRTDGPTVLCKGTQLSLNTMRSHLRSKGVQVTVSSQSVAVGTTITEMSWPTIHPFTSTPLKASRPAKKPRVKLEEDKEMGNISSAGTDPQDSTYDHHRIITCFCHVNAIP